MAAGIFQGLELKSEAVPRAKPLGYASGGTDALAKMFNIPLGPAAKVSREREQLP